MDKRNLVLTGFMGAGKTSVGRVAARRLDREFVDMDQVIAAREGAPVAEIFARYGEAYFRARERELCAELAARDDLVIATGGGTLMDPVNRTQFASATVICLDASAEAILHRLNGTGDRPLLNSEFGIRNSELDDGRRERIQELLAARREAYAQIPVHVDTTGRAIEDVARQVLERFAVGAGLAPAHDAGQPQRTRPERSEGSPLRVRTPDGSYPIWLGRGVLDRIGEILPRAEFAARCAVVTNPTVGQLYAARVTDSLRTGGFDPVVVGVPDGEEHKNLDTLRGLYDQFIHAGLERSSMVLALGGGVIGDLAGFAAATFMRGVPFVQLPTTLLAMVDASIGGKVAVDHPSGKNLIGAFKFPRAVIADPDVLATLPVQELRAGLAEVVKHAIVGDAALFDELADGEVNPDLIARAMRVKIDVVERDPFEANVRAHLNLGHTFGHALETLSGYRLRHGYAVAIGLTIAARLAARIGWCRAATRDRIVDLLDQKSLPTRTPREFDAAQVLEAMGADKKIREGRLRLILPRAIGLVEIADAERVPREEIAAALEESRTSP
jgi:shikimate kinase/3-dehydroquinate synthase